MKDEAVQRASLEKVRQALLDLAAVSTEAIDSPILGAEGNREFLLHARF